MKDKYFIVTSCFKNKGSWKWQHKRRNVAIIETDGTVPKIITDRAKFVKKIHWVQRGLYEGIGSGRSQYDKALVEAEDILEKLNKNLKEKV